MFAFLYFLFARNLNLEQIRLSAWACGATRMDLVIVAECFVVVDKGPIDDDKYWWLISMPNMANYTVDY